MTFIVVRGFYPEPNPDNSLQYEKDVPNELEMGVLNAMGWTSQNDIPQASPISPMSKRWR